MHPLFGFILFFVVTALATVVASKRVGLGTITFVVCCAAGLAVVPLTVMLGGTPFAAGSLALLVPIVALLWAALTTSSEQRALLSGSYGDFKKCPYCAESIRREAIKCKHCGSSLVDSSTGEM